MGKPRIEYILVCDDIRNEVGNKASYIGVYGNRILIRNFPYTFPKLCFAICIKPGGRYRVSLGLKYRGKEVFKFPEKKIGERKDRKTELHGDALVIYFGFGPFKVEKEGKAEFLIFLNRSKHAKRFKIEKAKDPTVFSPSVQRSTA